MTRSKQHPDAKTHKPPAGKSPIKLRVAFILAPRFTLTAFAGFVDALRLAADEGDRSRQIECQWTVLDAIGQSGCPSTVHWHSS